MRIAHTPIPEDGAASRLIEIRAASRLASRDESLFGFDLASTTDASVSMGWVDLASSPPYDVADIRACADAFVDEGVRDVILIGQGGSTQAAMVLTNLARKEDRPRIHTLDTVSPSAVASALDTVDPSRSLVIVASKSGTTVEVLSVYRVVRERFDAVMGPDAAGRRFVAITDRGSKLEKLARTEAFRSVLNGAPNVGGRFSALSVFGLFPAALAGVDIELLVARATAAEARCARDEIDNPALLLASFLHDALIDGRDKFSLVTPPDGRVFGLWVEQLVAESLGKSGVGILPNIEIDATLLRAAPVDRTVVVFRSKEDRRIADEAARLRDVLPVFEIVADDYHDLGAGFVMWEYATAMVAALMGVDPFDQPDVAQTKRAVEFVLSGALLAPPALRIDGGTTVDLKVGPGPALVPSSLEEAVSHLVGSMRPGDYFSLLSFIPFDGRRREPLERIRHCVAEHLGIASCLEIGPRYLHSTGQLHKGGPDSGVFLILSGTESTDLAVPGASFSLGELQRAQARGDLAALSNRDRRVLHVHLPSIEGDGLSRFADLFCAVTRTSTGVR